jgi:hypothetical protein
MADQILFHRTELARQMTKQLLHPGVLDQGLRSGLFLSGQRRTGKTTFLQADLIPELEAAGAIVVYTDLWVDPNASPVELLLASIRATLQELQTPAGAMAERLKRLRKAELAVGPVKLGFQIESVGRENGPTLAQALTEVVDQAKCDVIVIVDEVQHTLASADGDRMLLALKAARDAINPRPGTPGHFIFVGTGSHRAMVSELTARTNQAFVGATSLDFPLLGAEYVTYLLDLLRTEGAKVLPSEAAALDAFVTIGQRPEELIKALRLLRNDAAAGGNADHDIKVIARVLRSRMAAEELRKVEELGALARTVFELIAAAEGDAKGLFANEAMEGYSSRLGRPVRQDEVQAAIGQLTAANIVMRRGYGQYGLTDPVVKQLWLEDQALGRAPRL